MVEWETFILHTDGDIFVVQQVCKPWLSVLPATMPEKSSHLFEP